MSSKKKSILLCAGTDAGAVFSKRFIAALGGSEYTFQICRIDEVFGVLFMTEPSSGVPRYLREMTPGGTGIKRALKALLCCKKINHFLAKIYYPIDCVCFFSFIAMRQRLRMHRAKKRLQRLISELDVSAVIFTGAAPILPFQGVYLSLLPAKVPVVMVPSYQYFSRKYMCTIAAGFSEGRKDHFDHWLADRLIPHWADEWEGQKIYPFAPFALLALVAGGVKRSTTTKELRARISMVFFSSEWDKTLSLEYGDVPDTWPVTGSLDSDFLHAAYKNRDALHRTLCNEFGFNASRTVAFDLNDFPQPYLAVLLDLAGIAENNGWNAIFCQKPGVAKRHADYCKHTGFAVAHGRTVEILPLSSLYVTIESTTAIWAAQLGIPTVSVGMNGCSGVTQWPGSRYFEKEDLEDFIAFLKEILSNDCTYNNLFALAQSKKHIYGLQDGKCGERMSYFFNKYLCSN